MATRNDEEKDKQGRKFGQLTQDGTGSAASVGPGGTGDLQQGGNQQSATRTDDLLSDGSEADQRGGYADKAGAGDARQRQGGQGGNKG